jgi:hypothetical protein
MMGTWRELGVEQIGKYIQGLSLLEKGVANKETMQTEPTSMLLD